MPTLVEPIALAKAAGHVSGRDMGFFTPLRMTAGKCRRFFERALVVVFMLIICASSPGRSTDLLREQVSQREDIHLLQEKLDQLKTDLQAIEVENETLNSEITSLKADLAAARKSHENFQKDIARLDGLLRKLDATREQDRETIVEEVGREINRLLKKDSSKPPPSSGKSPKPKVQEGVEHTVEKGQTLIAIAEAYKTSPKSIMEANHMTKPELKVEQKLFIPKENKASPKKR